jgi:hypothetical protein
MNEQTKQAFTSPQRSDNPKPEHAEGTVARTIEEQTAKLPSDLFLWAAGASMVGSALLHLTGRKDDANFVGHWAPSFLILGLYNKLVKVAGSDAGDLKRRAAGSGG